MTEETSAYDTFRQEVSRAREYLPGAHSIEGLEEDVSDIEWEFYEVPEEHQPAEQFEDLNDEVEKEKSRAKKYATALLATNIGIAETTMQYGEAIQETANALPSPFEEAVIGVAAAPYAISGLAAMTLITDTQANLEKKAEESKPFDQLPGEYEPGEVIAIPRTDMREVYDGPGAEEINLDSPRQDLREIEEDGFERIEVEQTLEKSEEELQEAEQALEEKS